MGWYHNVLYTCRWNSRRRRNKSQMSPQFVDITVTGSGNPTHLRQDKYNGNTPSISCWVSWRPRGEGKCWDHAQNSLSVCGLSIWDYGGQERMGSMPFRSLNEENLTNPESSVLHMICLHGGGKMHLQVKEPWGLLERQVNAGARGERREKVCLCD